MANTYYDSQLTAAEIEAALEAIDGVIVPANNGKVLAINNGKLEARSVQWGGGEPTIEPLSVTVNGTYTAPSGVDGYSPITVNVSGSGAVVQSLSVTQNGTYNPPSGVDGYAPVVVNVSGGGVIIPIYDSGVEYVSLDIVNNCTKNQNNIKIETGGGTFTNYLISNEPITIGTPSICLLYYSYKGVNSVGALYIPIGTYYLSFGYLTDFSHNEGFIGISETKERASSDFLWYVTTASQNNFYVNKIDIIEL